MERVNTFTMWFDSGKMLCMEEVARFLKRLSIEPSMLECVQEEFGPPRVHVKVRNEYSEKLPIVGFCVWAKKDGSEELVFITRNGENVIKTKVRNLPPEISDDAVKSLLNQYGLVFNLKIDKYEDGPFQGIPNGDRSALMCVRKYIPNYVMLNGYEAKIEYRGQPKSCRKCGVRGHVRAACRTQPPQADDAIDLETAEPPPSAPRADDVRASCEPPPPAKQADDAPHDKQQPVMAATEGAKQGREAQKSTKMNSKTEEWNDEWSMKDTVYNKRQQEEKKKEERRKREKMKFK